MVQKYTAQHAIVCSAVAEHFAESHLPKDILPNGHFAER
jgi:hypothetical protein